MDSDPVVLNLLLQNNLLTKTFSDFGVTSIDYGNRFKKRLALSGYFVGCAFTMLVNQSNETVFAEFFKTNLDGLGC